MICFPPAKINIGLSVLRKRSDGYHDIESLFYPVPFCDILEIVPFRGDDLFFEMAGREIPGELSENLCVKAFRMLQETYGLPAVKMFLYKNIPTGAGLGGGSSDAAFTLKMLNGLFALQLPDSQLKILAARLGSDCPFFIDPMPSLATGRGELLEPMHPGLSGFFAVIVKPPVNASTAHAYAMIQPMLPELPVRDLIRLPVKEWQGRLGNDFEGPVSRKIPQIAQLKQKLLEAGAVYASMTGSGSAVYGLFDREPVLGKALVECLVWKGFLK